MLKRSWKEFSIHAATLKTNILTVCLFVVYDARFFVEIYLYYEYLTDYFFLICYFICFSVCLFLFSQFIRLSPTCN